MNNEFWVGIALLAALFAGAMGNERATILSCATEGKSGWIIGEIQCEVIKK